MVLLLSAVLSSELCSGLIRFEDLEESSQNSKLWRFLERNTCQDGTGFAAHMSTHMSQSTLSLVFGNARSVAAAQPNSNKGNRVIWVELLRNESYDS